MAQQPVEIPGVGTVEFPDTMSDTEISAAAARLYRESQQTLRPSREQVMRMSPTELRQAGIAPHEVPALISGRETERTRPGREFLTGAAKRVAEMGVRGGAMLRQIPGVQAVAERFPSVTVPIERTTSAERAGATAADLATIGKVGGVVSTAVKGMMLPARMAAEGASMAGVAALQGTDPRVAGVVAATLPVAGTVLARTTQALPQAFRDQAAKKVAQALGATKERFKALAQKRAPEILRRGLRGSRRQLLQDAQAHAREAGHAIDEVLTGAGTQQIPIAPIVDALEEAKHAFVTTRQISIAQAKKEGILQAKGIRLVGDIVEVPNVLDARPIRQLTQLQTVIRNLGDDASVEHLTAVRRVWDDVVARAGGFAHRAGSTFGVPLAEQTEAWAKREATTAIRKALADQVPNLAKVNQEYAFWKDLQDILRATQARTQAQKTGLISAMASITGAGVGFGSGERLEERVQFALAGAAGGQVYRLLTSAPWRLVDAHLRHGLADALASGSPGRILSAAARIGAVKGASRTETSASQATTTPPAEEGRQGVASR